MRLGRVAGGWPRGSGGRSLLLALGVAVLFGQARWNLAGAFAAPHAPVQSQPSGLLVRTDGSGSVRLPDGVTRLVWAPAGERFAMVQADGGGATVSVAGAADPDAAVTVYESSDSDVTDLQWSPDGNALAIVAGFSLQVVSADGGDGPRRLAEHVYAFAWTPDSAKLTVMQWDGESGHGESLTTFSAVDGAAQDRILPVQTAVCPSRLAWSPDGTLLAFSAGLFQNPVCGDQEPTAHGLWLWDETAHALRQLEKQTIAPAPHWTADGRIVAEREDTPFVHEIVAYTPAGDAQTLATYQDNCREPDDLGAGVQLGGGTLLYLDTSGDLPQIVLMPLSGRDPVSITPPDRYTALPLLSPDGAAVAYASAGDGDFADLAVAAADGTPRVAVAGNGLSLRPQSWSADGSLLFVSAEGVPLRRCSRVDQ